MKYDQISILNWLDYFYSKLNQFNTQTNTIVSFLGFILTRSFTITLFITLEIAVYCLLFVRIPFVVDLISSFKLMFAWIRKNLKNTLQ